MITDDLVMAHTWDHPNMVSHFGRFHKQTPSSGGPWLKTLCGRTVLPNGDRSGAYPCEECEKAMDEQEA